MPRYRNTVQSNKTDYSYTTYEQNGRVVTEGEVKVTQREQVPRTNQPMLTSSGYHETPRGNGGGAHRNFQTYQSTQKFNFRSEAPIGGGGRNHPGHMVDIRAIANQAQSSQANGGQEVVAYGGQGRVTTVHGQMEDRWVSGPNRNNPRGGGRRY